MLGYMGADVSYDGFPILLYGKYNSRSYPVDIGILAIYPPAYLLLMSRAAFGIHGPHTSLLRPVDSLGSKYRQWGIPSPYLRQNQRWTIELREIFLDNNNFVFETEVSELLDIHQMKK